MNKKNELNIYIYKHSLKVPKPDRFCFFSEQKIGYFDQYITEISDITRYQHDFSNRLSVGQKISQKSVQSPIFQRNIIIFRYFDEISRVYLTRACVEIFEKISINIIDISVKYRKYRRYIDYFDLNQIHRLKLNHNDFLTIQWLF